MNQIHLKMLREDFDSLSKNVDIKFIDEFVKKFNVKLIENGFSSKIDIEKNKA